MKTKNKYSIVLPVIALVTLIMFLTFNNKNIFLLKKTSYAYPSYDSKPLLTYKDSSILNLKTDNISSNPTIISTNTNISLTLSNPNSDKKTNCTYDIYFVWDGISDSYVKSENVDKELVISGYVNKNALFKSVQVQDIKNYKTLLYKGTLSIEESQIKKQIIDINFSFYDYKQNQESQYNKSFVGKITVDNIICLEEN